MSNASNYNLPGSSYYKLQCLDGEVIPVACDQGGRNILCMDIIRHETNFKEAQCIGNDWRSCLEKTTKNSCEGDSDYGTQFCKWVPGFRFDAEVKTTKTSNRYNVDQGSCVPLFSPGFEFWGDPETSGQTCFLANIQGAVTYSTHFTTSRDNFADFNTQDAAHHCMNDCYFIPEYASDLARSDIQDQKEMEDIFTGGSAPDDLKDLHVSQRKAYYCEGKTGKARGESVNCADDEDKRNKYPIFWTHQQFLDSIRDRARSLGDCGYKPGAYITLDQLNEDNLVSELMVVVFQKVDQQGDPKDEPGAAEKLYINDEYVGDKCGYRDGSEIDEELCQIDETQIEETSDEGEDDEE